MEDKGDKRGREQGTGIRNQGLGNREQGTDYKSLKAWQMPDEVTTAVTSLPMAQYYASAGSLNNAGTAYTLASNAGTSSVYNAQQLVGRAH